MLLLLNSLKSAKLRSFCFSDPRNFSPKLDLVAQQQCLYLLGIDEAAPLQGELDHWLLRTEPSSLSCFVLLLDLSSTLLLASGHVSCFEEFNIITQQALG